MRKIADLVARLKAKQYKSKPVKRVYIPKPNGEKRPLGSRLSRIRSSRWR